MQTGPPAPAAPRDRSVWIWGPLAALALWWPAQVRGPLDGAPLDRPLEAILLGLVFPALWWFYPDFLRRPLVQAGIASLLMIKGATALIAPAGWCVRFDPPNQIVRGGTGRPHSWDVRADWRSPNPQCSAVMTREYEDFKQFPIWFYNLPPMDDNLPNANDRPPNVVLPMSIVGFMETRTSGVFEVSMGPGMDLNVGVDGALAVAIDPLTRRIDLEPGVHFVQISGTLTGSRWRLVPRWNGIPLGSIRFPTITGTPPGDLEWLNRFVLRWLAIIVAALLVTSWIVAALLTVGDLPTVVWTIAAGAGLAIVGWQTASDLVASPLARWSITALAAALLVPVPERLRTIRGAFLLIGVPWLAFIAVGFFDHIGRFSFYTGGEDAWSIQRYGYSIFLQGHWIEGGSPTFYFQPLYRWTSGALHMLFGDSSLGEFYADAAALLAAGLYGYRVVAATAGHRWGVITAVTLLTIVMQGPTFGFVGRGLTDISSAGFIYMSALVALNRQPDGSIRTTTVLAAAALAILALYTRPNNLPVALSVAAMAIPLGISTRALWRPAELLRQTSLSLVAGLAVALAAALLLFALHTWYYTGVFSVTYGTAFAINRVWLADQSWSVGFQRMIESFMVVLTLNDPPHLSPYSIPLLLAAASAVAAVIGIKGFRKLPLAVVLFFLGCASISLVVRGIAYSGRYSTHLLGAASAVAVLTIAMAAGQLKRTSEIRSEPPPEAES